jgi:hypothetical protein
VIAHRSGCAPGGTVEHGVDVADTVSAGAGYLDSAAIVEVTCDGAPDRRHAHQFVLGCNAESELHSAWWAMMPVMSGDEGARLSEGDRHNRQMIRHVSRPIDQYRRVDTEVLSWHRQHGAEVL